jgi:hypothetical protein
VEKSRLAAWQSTAPRDDPGCRSIRMADPEVRNRDQEVVLFPKCRADPAGSGCRTSVASCGTDPALRVSAVRGRDVVTTSSEERRVSAARSRAVHTRCVRSGHHQVAKNVQYWTTLCHCLLASRTGQDLNHGRGDSPSRISAKEAKWGEGSSLPLYCGIRRDFCPGGQTRRPVRHLWRREFRSRCHLQPAAGEGAG